MRWSIHHVNMCVPRVARTRWFLRDLLGIHEGTLSCPDADQPGEIGDSDDMIAYFGTGNRGIHAVRPIAKFPAENGFLHNPPIGGRPVFEVPDLHELMARMRAANSPFDDAGTYAMRGMHQMYTYDPAMNVVEVSAPTR